MWLYFHMNPEIVYTRDSHKKCRLALIHMLVQPHLDYQADSFTEERRRPQCMNKTKRRFKNDSARLTGKHFAVRHEFRRICCCCAYQINQATGKRKETRTNDY